MNKKYLIAPLLLALASSPSLAGHRYQSEGDFFDRAHVVDVKPIIEIVEVPMESKACWDEEVHHPGRSARPHDNSGLIVGGLLGGIIGNQVGAGDGRKAATVVGTIVGAAVGNDMNRKKQYHYEPGYTTVEHRCQMRTEYVEEERVSGYRVTYKYHGQTFTTRMDRDPGKFIDVRVAVTPVE